MLGNRFGEGLGGLLMTTVKAGVIIAALSVLAANYVAQDVHSGNGYAARIAATERQRLAELSRDPRYDPQTTGSIGAARGTRLDPCGPR